MSWEGVAVSERNRDDIAWLIKAGFSYEEIKRYIRRAGPQPGTASHRQTIDTYMYSAAVEGTRPGTGIQSQQTVAYVADEQGPQAGCHVVTTSPFLARKLSAIDGALGVCVELQPGSSRSKLQKRTANYGSHQQTINYDNPTSPAFTRNSENQEIVTERRPYELRFSNKISQEVFTGKPINGENGRPLMVSLFDGESGQPVTSGPEASAGVELVVLEAAYFVKDSWTRGEFQSKIVLKEGNKSLLTGKAVLNLDRGIGCVPTFGFSQNKTWTRKRAYRLGAVVIDNDLGTKIKEAITDFFVVRDGHLESQKHDPPTLTSEVWQLVGIAKDGPFHNSLNKFNVKTVGDFLTKLNSEPKVLRNVVGTRMSARAWETLVAHARRCVFVDESHKFPTMDSSSDTNIELSPRIEEFDVSQQASSFFSGILRQ